MKLTEEQKEIALNAIRSEFSSDDDVKAAMFCIERFLSAMPNSDPVAEVVRNSAGQISLFSPSGDMFDVYKYVGCAIYAAPLIPQDVTFPVILDEERSKYVAREVKYEEKLQDYKAQLAESQAREAKLRKSLESYKWQIEGGLICVPNGSINEALDTPPDATAMNELIANAGDVMRERCLSLRSANLINSGCVRALPGVTLEDLNHD